MGKATLGGKNMILTTGAINIGKNRKG